ncbi:hypothetical protein, partial [Vibrio cholerae]|uniref:hypothetical protein n=1 Tax=Vibrio cholerae TaxID=666 RepID=UPI00307FFFA2
VVWLGWGAKAFTHSAGQPERVREKTPRKATINNTQITPNRVEWVGVGAAERALALRFSKIKKKFY